MGAQLFCDIIKHNCILCFTGAKLKKIMHFKLVDEIQPVSPDYLQTVTSSSHLFILRVIFTKIMFKKSLDLFTLRNFDKS